MRRYIVRKDLMENNIRVVKRAAGRAAIYGVLKGQGYGLGLAPMARALSGQGITRFALTEPADAAALCSVGVPVREILLLRPVTDAAELERLFSLPVTFSVGTEQDARALAMAARRMNASPRAHIQVDCGLGRYGFYAGAPERVKRLYSAYPEICFTGIYTHFPCAYRAGRTRRQYQRFCALIQALEAAGIDPGLRHCCSSSALFRYPDMAMDAVRVGSAFLGRIPEGRRFGLEPVGYCEADIDAVRILPAGATAGYGSLFRARHDMLVAVIDAGAVHGFGVEPGHGRQGLRHGLRELMSLLRRAAGRASSLYAVVGGKKTPVLGEVCAECAIVDVTACPCAAGDTAKLYINPLYQRHMDCVWTAEPGREITDTDKIAI